MTGPPSPDVLRDLFVDVNARIHDVAEQAGHGGSEENWEFRCECGAPGCNELVALPLVEYEALRGNGSAILASGHQFRPSAARERSAHLRSEAEALKNQARLQYKRALRNLETRPDTETPESRGPSGS